MPDLSFACSGDNLHGATAVVQSAEYGDGKTNQYGLVASGVHVTFNSIAVYGVNN